MKQYDVKLSRQGEVRQGLEFDWELWGALPGVLGAFLLASGLTVGRYGWIAFLVSNLAWIVFSVRHNLRKLLMQQIVFMASSCLGIFNTFGS